MKTLCDCVIFVACSVLITYALSVGIMEASRGLTSRSWRWWMPWIWRFNGNGSNFPLGDWDDEGILEGIYSREGSKNNLKLFSKDEGRMGDSMSRNEIGVLISALRVSSVKDPSVGHRVWLAWNPDCLLASFSNYFFSYPKVSQRGRFCTPVSSLG